MKEYSFFGYWPNIWPNNINILLAKAKFLYNIASYYTTLLKSVQITRKTSTKIAILDSWLFVYFRFDEFVFSQSNFVSGAVLHVC